MDQYDLGTLPDDEALAAIVAHGLLNTLAVLAGSASTIRRFEAKLAPSQRDSLTRAMVAQAELFTEGADVLLRHCSDAFADAAWVVESLGRRFRTAATDDQAVMLERLEASTTILRNGLESLVRGLPPDTIDLLDSMQRP